ncbi:hypothetical protein GCM10010378_25510 [Streptomyces viridochromogenes]
MRRLVSPDLVRTQHEWTVTYRELAAWRGGAARLRRRLLSLSVAVCGHPFWGSRGRFPLDGERLADLPREEEVDA